MKFTEARTEIEKKFPKAPSEFSDGVRGIRIEDIPSDTEAEIDDAMMSVKIPAAHHTKLHQGWLTGYWSA